MKEEEEEVKDEEEEDLRRRRIGRGGMPPELPNLGPRPPRICITDLASTIIGPDINAKCTDVKFLIHPFLGSRETRIL